MPIISEVTGDDLKAQLNEYHILVAEVIGGMSADLTEHENRIKTLESKIEILAQAYQEIQSSNRLLIKEILSIKINQAVEQDQ